jgi:hypothetical protein
LAQPFDKSVQIFDEIFGSNLGLIVIIHVHIGSMFREWCQGAIRGGGGAGCISYIYFVVVVGVVVGWLLMVFEVPIGI